MVVGGQLAWWWWEASQHDDGGGPSDSFLSLSYKCFVYLKFFILVIVKQCISFNNQKYFGENTILVPTL